MPLNMVIFHAVVNLNLKSHKEMFTDLEFSLSVANFWFLPLLDQVHNFSENVVKHCSNIYTKKIRKKKIKFLK